MDLRQNLIEIGKDIKREREKQDMTAVELARRCQMSVSALVRIENGKTLNPNLESLDMICKVLEIRENILIG